MDIVIILLIFLLLVIRFNDKKIRQPVSLRISMRLSVG